MNDALLFTLISCLGMLIQSFVGFAGSLVAVPLFAFFFDPKEAIPAYQFVMILVDVWLVIESKQHVDFRRVRRLLVGGLIGIPIGAYALKQLPTHTISIGISAITLFFALLFILKVKVPLKEDRRTQFGAGLLSGLLGGCISESGPPVVIFGLARGWDKNSFRTTLLTYFLCLAFMTMISYLYFGLFTRKSLFTGSVAVVPTFFAAWCGVLLKDRVGESLFRQAVLSVVVAVSLIGLSRLFYVH